MQTRIAAILEQQLVSSFDQHGSPCQWSELKEFLTRTSHVSIREIGRQTYLMTDSGFDPETFGFNRSFVVILKLDCMVDLVALNLSGSAVAA